MKQSLIVLLPFVLNACGGSEPPQVDLIGQNWHLMYATSDIGIKHVPPNTAHYSLQFLEDGRLTGNIDCNSLEGRYSASEGRISISDLSWTEINCPHGHGTTSTLFQTALHDTVSYTTQQHGLLTLEDRAGRQLKFEEAPVLCETPLPVTVNAGHIYTITATNAAGLVEELEAARPDFMLVESDDCSPAFRASLNQNTLTRLRCRTDIESLD